MGFRFLDGTPKWGGFFLHSNLWIAVDDCCLEGGGKINLVLVLIICGDASRCHKVQFSGTREVLRV
jgi:hypothetical protein